MKTRRQFVSSTLTLAAATVLPVYAKEQPPVLAVTRNASPAALVAKAIEMIGGISKFVKAGQSVLIKPNISWDRLAEQAATTNPQVVAEVVRLCKNAGARQIRIVDRTCNHAQRCYKRSGIEKMASDAGAQVRHVVNSRFKETAIAEGRIVKSWPIYKDVFDADVVINIPIAKHHNVSGVSLGMKNIMGLLGGNRGDLHVDFATKIVDLNTVIRPTLTIIDAYRVLRRNGPSGGSLDDVEEKKVVIAGTDPVAVDAYAVQLFGLQAQNIHYLNNAAKRGLGRLDLAKVRIIEHNFSA